MIGGREISRSAALVAAALVSGVRAELDSRLWYDQPAELWTDALPIGNGRLGAMIYGKPDSETLQINEETVWSGGPTDRLNQNASQAVTQVRELLANEQVEEAEKLADLGLVSTPQAQRYYQTLGNIEVYFDGGLDEYNNGSYERWLDLDNATAGVHFSINDTQIERELFASAPDDVIVHRLTAQGGGKLSFQMRVNRPQDNINTASDKSFNRGGNSVFMTGAAGSSNPIVFAAGITVQTDGNLKAWGEFLVVDNATEAVAMFAATTTYREEDPVAAVESTLNSARQHSYEDLRQRHIDDYQAIYDTCSLKLGKEDNSTTDILPTNERINATQNGANDLDLITLEFNYGRYLLISSSRPGTLPANLQGIWNEDFESAWGSKFTININTEMNYWPAELTNLPSLHQALFDHIEKVRVNGEVVAREMYNASGWVVHHNTDIHGDAAPQDRYPPASYWTLTSAWLCTHILEHYFYSGNQTFLQEKLPTLTGAIQFYLDTLQPYQMNGTTYLVTNPSTSPENTYYTASNASGSMTVGPTCDFQILRELFTGYQHAVASLPSHPAINTTFLAAMNTTMSRFPPPKISTRYPGVLQEWLHDYAEAEPGHRHISHLYALYPGTQIPPPDAPGHNPTLWAAARKTLDYRLENGGAGTGWSRAWTINWAARLLDGAALADNVFEFFNRSAYPNLFDAHPPFQIDGNFGFAAGVAEGLLQSHFVREDGAREVWLLPALPEGWSEGRVDGLVARGGFVVGFEWSGGRVGRVSLESRLGGRVVVKFDVGGAGGGRVDAGEGSDAFGEAEDGMMSLETEEGGKYEFSVMWD